VNLYDKIWLKFNKRSHSKVVSYLGTVLPWVCIGVILTFLLLLVPFIKEVPWYIFLVFIAWFFFLSFYSYWDDRKKGYLDAIHQNYLRRRQEKIDRISK